MYSPLKTYYEKETSASFKDSLTGLFNHGFFQLALERDIEMSKRYDTPFALVLIDIDLFSAFNKLQGYLEGDRKLKELAGLILNNIRKVDLAARYSSDVIAIILSNSNARSAFVMIERFRQAVEKTWHRELTISGGVVSFPDDSSNIEGLLKKAHEALRTAKVRGKNRVYFFEQIDSKAVNAGRPKILVVDDEPRNVKLLEALLLPLNYEVIKALSGNEALSIIKRADPDLILLDIMMPEMDGYEVCRRIKKAETTRLIPVVMVTALDDIEAKVKGIDAGADDFLTKPPNKTELLARIKSLLNVKALNNSLISIENVLFSLANAVEAKDAYTQGHIERVANMAVDLGKKMALSATQINALRLGGILHDIGKIGISKDILNKPGPLNEEELKIMKSHSDAGYKICLPLEKNLGKALEVIKHHHEKLDGSGYPDGLKGDEISVEARVMAVVDIYDALITDRPYRRGMPIEKAIEILRQDMEQGRLDKKIVTHLTEMIPSMNNYKFCTK